MTINEGQLANSVMNALEEHSRRVFEQVIEAEQELVKLQRSIEVWAEEHPHGQRWSSESVEKAARKVERARLHYSYTKDMIEFTRREIWSREIWSR